LRTVLLAGLAVVALAGAVAGCGGSSSTPQATLRTFLADWSRGDWAAMQRLVSTPPASFARTNAAVFTALGVPSAAFTAGPIRTSGSHASAPVTERFELADVGAWSPVTTVRLVQRNGRWLVAWTPSTINPALGAGDGLATRKAWPARSTIVGAGGAPLIAQHDLVTVGVVGSRVKDASAVAAYLIAAGATAAQANQALALAQAHPTLFEPVWQITQARFEQLKAAPGPDNVYAVPGTQFELAAARSAITPQLAAHVVGQVGPITAAQLKALGSPYDASSQVGQTGLEEAYERRLAGTPTITVVVVDGAGDAVVVLKTFPGRSGQPVKTSIDPAVQRAAESALSGVHHTVAMVALRASTGQVLAVVSDPASSGYDQALQGEYPPGSTFKVITSTALIQAGLSPASPASCPPSLNIDGETFHNAEGDQPVQTVDEAFTESCNTAFIDLATSHLSGADFTSAANLYGLGRISRPGLPAFDAYVPAPAGKTALAATAIGQAGVVFSPLGMATVAAAVDSGTTRMPVIVDGAPDASVAPQPVPTAVADDLRLMMGHVVASGTAAGTGLPPTTHAKTGTAQYGTGTNLKIDAWLMGYDGDIAFAIVVQNSGGANGGPLDGPIIAKFLDALGSAA
jgi:cell division protein FtsI/penicillin-binding protein 2